MSFNLGNWADQLRCELCTGDDDLDLDVPDDFYDDDYDPDLFDDMPDPAEDPDLFDDFPTGIPLGDNAELYPDWNGGPGLGVRGWW